MSVLDYMNLYILKLQADLDNIKAKHNELMLRVGVSEEYMFND